MTPETQTHLLKELAAELAADGQVEISAVFSNRGIRVGTKIVAFLGRDERLVVKLPWERAQEIVSTGAADFTTIGARTMREWIAIPLTADPAGTRDVWLPLAREALRYVQEGA